MIGQLARIAVTLQLMALIIAAFVAAPSLASTIRGLEIDEVASAAEFIFEGRVIDHQVRRDSNSGLIHTYVTFAVLDVLKGEHGGDTLELRFSGGILDGEMVEVSGLSIPEMDEAGVYFVESLQRPLLNPLLGWSQGHYLIKEEQNSRSMTTLDGRAVTDVQSMAGVPQVLKKPLTNVDGANAAAQGVIIDYSELRSATPLTVDEFKTRIRGLLD